MKVTEKGETSNKVAIGEVAYGCLVMGVPGHPDIPYVKVNKRSACVSSDKVAIKWTPNYCVLFNLKSGTLRGLAGSTKVTVLKGECIYEQVDEPSRYFKTTYPGDC